MITALVLAAAAILGGFFVRAWWRGQMARFVSHHGRY